MSGDRLAAEGGSAGGLLVGSAAMLAPERFAGVLAEVPFVDALTTMLDPSLPLTVTEYEEWGNPTDDPDAYADIAAYSPYDLVRSGCAIRRSSPRRASTTPGCPMPSRLVRVARLRANRGRCAPASAAAAHRARRRSRGRSGRWRRLAPGRLGVRLRPGLGRGDGPLRGGLGED